MDYWASSPPSHPPPSSAPPGLSVMARRVRPSISPALTSTMESSRCHASKRKSESSPARMDLGVVRHDRKDAAPPPNLPFFLLPPSIVDVAAERRAAFAEWEEEGWSVSAVFWRRQAPLSA